MKQAPPRPAKAGTTNRPNRQPLGRKAHVVSVVYPSIAASISCVKTLLPLALVFVLALTGRAATNTTETADAYTRTITKRSAEIVTALGLTDAAKSNRVQEILVAQYRSLNAWHEQHDAELKALNKAANSAEKEAAVTAKEKAKQVRATLKPIHDDFLAKLGNELSAEQIETVKDKMTYGKVQFTYQGFLNVVPNMTDEEKAHVLALLKEARELAMDGGSAEEKSAIFNKYKGKINNYLSQRGHDISGKAKPQPAQ